MASPFLDGLVAGYGISIPLGAIAVLIINQAMERGLRSGLWAAAGTASVDFAYAVIAVLAGQIVSANLSPYATPLRILSGTVLIALGVHGIWKAWRPWNESTAKLENGRGTFARFFAVTALNPFTLVYFTALVVGNPSIGSGSALDGLLFVCGVGLASLSWQSLLAGLGAGAKAALPPHFRRFTSVAGGLLVIALGIVVLLG